MYTIKMDGNTVWDNRTPEVGIYEAKVSLKDNSTQTLDVNVAAQHDPFPGLKMMQSIITVYQDDEANPIFEGRPISRKTDFYGNITYQFEGCLGYLYDSIQSPAVYTGQTIEYIFRALIEEHNKQVEPWKQFQVGVVTVVDIYTDSSTYSGQGRLADNDPTEKPDYIYQQDSNKTGIDQTELTTGYESTFDAINNLLVQNLSGHLVVRYENGVRYLDYLKDYLPSEGQIILFGSNLLDYSSTLDYSSICTGILPLGYSRGSDDFDKDNPDNPENPSSIYTEQEDPLQTVKNKLTVSSVNNGSKIIWNDEAVQNYGRIVKMKEWSNIKDPQKLYDKAKKYLLSTQFDNLSLECKIVDLHFVDKSVGPLHHMHMVRVKSDPIGMDRSVPISEMDIDLLNPANDTVTLGATYNSISGKLACTSNNLSSVSSGLKDTQTTIENNNNTYWTNITKTDQAISLEAHERQKSENELHEKITSEYDAALKITARNISSTVSENQKKNDETFASYNSRINQTARDITTEVSERQKGDNDLETSITSVAKQTPTSFSLGFKNNGGTNNVLTLTYDVDNQEKKAEIDLTTFVMTVLKYVDINTPKLTVASTDGKNSSTITKSGLGTTGEIWAHHFIASNDPADTSSGGSGNEVTLYGQRKIMCGTDDHSDVSDYGVDAKHTIYLDSSGYDEKGNKRDGIRFDCDIFCGDNNSMVATRKWVSENFKTGYIKKSDVGVDTYINGCEGDYTTYAKMKARKDQLVDMVNDLRRQLSDYKSSHKYSNTEYNNKTATVHTIISGAESSYPTDASLQARKNQLVDWVSDLRAQVRAGCAKGTTPVH